ncbi:MAG: MoaD/ThiS family protein [Anaerolineae bacterium]|nr:MoaD/ThiS family protein [Anaerolineae bacterium]
MKVTVRMGMPLSQVVGEAKASLSMPEGSTVAELLDALRARYPDFEAGLQGKGLRGTLRQVPYTLFVNARPVPFDGAAAATLRDGDRVYLFLPVAGG